MHRRIVLPSVIVVVVAIALVGLTSSSIAQSTAAGHSERKVVMRVSPAFPELAKRMHIHGVVRVEVVVHPNGAVKSTRVLGGNPVLVDAAIGAVEKWKFEAGPNETTEILQLTFETQ